MMERLTYSESCGALSKMPILYLALLGNYITFGPASSIVVIFSVRTMLSSAVAVRGFRVTANRFQSSPRRYASHGPQSYNEPSGWLFGEKVRTCDSYPSPLLSIGEFSLFPLGKNE